MASDALTYKVRYDRQYPDWLMVLPRSTQLVLLRTMARRVFVSRLFVFLLVLVDAHFDKLKRNVQELENTTWQWQVSTALRISLLGGLVLSWVCIAMTLGLSLREQVVAPLGLMLALNITVVCFCFIYCFTVFKF